MKSLDLDMDSYLKKKICKYDDVTENLFVFVFL